MLNIGNLQDNISAMATLLANSEYQSQTLVSSKGVPNGFVWIRKEMIPILQVSGRLIVKWPLTTLMVRDKYNTWLPAAHMLLKEENSQIISSGTAYFIQVFKL